MADPFGSLAAAGLFGTLSPRQQGMNRLAELLAEYQGASPAQQNALAGTLSMPPTQERDPAKLGPPTVQPGSFNWWADQALNFTPVGAGRDLATAVSDAEALPPNPSWGDLAPVIGGGILAAAGAVPGGKQTARAAKLYGEALDAARKAGLDTAPAARTLRMKEQGYNDQYWRGGGDVADGPWYATDPRKAANFDRGDVRQYALDERGMLRADRAYGEQLFRDIAKQMESYNPAAAKEWRKMADAGERVSGP